MASTTSEYQMPNTLHFVLTSRSVLFTIGSFPRKQAHPPWCTTMAARRPLKVAADATAAARHGDKLIAGLSSHLDNRRTSRERDEPLRDHDDA